MLFTTTLSRSYSVLAMLLAMLLAILLSTLRLLILPSVLALLAPSFVWSASQQENADFAGSSNCVGCHQQEFEQWQGSHHDLAMQHANAETLLGDFSDTTFDYNGIRSRFFIRDGDYWVNADGPDGQLADFKIAFAFGVDPLQQYLIQFDDGRLQALSIAWDSRPAESGGQRWFHLYPDEQVHSGDVLHWTRQSHNWNLQCAACHSTDLDRNYDLESNSYQTTWFEIDVACEACHGPAAAHANWAKASETSTGIELADKAIGRYKGFDRNLSVTSQWLFEEGKSTATNKQIATDNTQIQTCAGCHSRRSVIGEEFGNEVLDQYIPAHIQPGLYHADGQILDEVYVYGSFTQSKMFQNGVTCSNCHNPHSLELKAPGNLVCAQCHLPTVYDTEQHHHHSAASSGAMCVNCHMPETTYMVVDPRRDHSIRIPQPLVSKLFDAPNACNQCHLDETVDWAVEKYQGWYGESKLSRTHPAYAFHAAENDPAESTHLLQNIAHDPEQTDMLRASAIARMSANPSQEVVNSAIRLLESEQPYVRFSAVGLFEILPQQQRPEFLWPLLNDPVKAVRIESARLLAGLRPADPAQAAVLQVAVDEYEQSIKLNSDTSAGISQLGALYMSQRMLTEAEKAYQHALQLEPFFIPARLNLADIYREQGDEVRALEILSQGLQLIPDQADISFAAGLSLIRQNKLSDAADYLASAATQAPNNPRYAYVYAVALYESGETEASIAALKTSLQLNPNNRDIVSALASYLEISGDMQQANKYRLQLQNLN